MMTFFDALALRLLSSAKGTLYDYCPLDTRVNETTFVTRAGNLVTFLLIEGNMQVANDLNPAVLRELETALSGILEKPYHQLQWVFSKSPLSQEQLMNEYIEHQLQSASRMQFDASVIRKILQEKAKTLSGVLHQEMNILVLTTIKQLLPKHQQSKELITKTQKGILSKLRLPNRVSQLSQPLFTHTQDLERLHQPAIDSLLMTLQRPPLSLSARMLNCHESLKWIRRRLHPESTSHLWQPRLPGDAITVKAESAISGERDDIYHPSIGRQLFTTQAKTHNTLMHCGERFWTSVYLTLTPLQIRPFTDLLTRIPASIDWQVSMTLVGGSDNFKGKIKTKETLAKLCQIGGSSYNREIAQGCKALNEIFAHENACGFRLIIAVCADTADAAKRDGKSVAQILQGWGYCDVGFEMGCAIDAVISSFPAFDRGGLGETLVMPVNEAVSLLPFNRPFSPWPLSSSTLWGSLDGKLFSYQAGSTLQKTWVSLIYAPPGSGKSMLMNLLNFDLVFSAGQKELPYLSILDIGSSSQGFIDLLQACLPVAKRQLVRHIVLTNAKQSAINPFDTPLGFRRPIPSAKQFLSNFLLELFTERGQTISERGVGEIVDDLIDAAYRSFHDDYEPKIYEENVAPEIDKALEHYPNLRALMSDNQTTLSWWKIVDTFSHDGKYSLAAMAQRHAVPTLEDLARVLRADKNIKDNYQRTKEGENLIERLSQLLSARIRKFPMLCHPSVMDITGSRVVAVDLSKVIVKSSKTDNTNGLMYLLARHLLIGHFYQDVFDLDNCPLHLRDYHEKRLHTLKQHTKRACFDEFHRTESRENVVKQVEEDMREARKFNIEYKLASQIHRDFTDTMVDLASNIFICQGSDDKSLDEMVERFGLNATAKELLKNKIHGASKDGATFLFKSKIKEKVIIQPLRNIAGKHMLWALNTVAEDADFRSRLQTVMSYDEAISLLVKWFPEGTTKTLYESRLASHPHLTKQAFYDEFFDLLVRSLHQPVTDSIS